MLTRVDITHWLPIVTFCPVNKLPDLLYITVTFQDDELHELYNVRKQIRKAVSYKCMFMEDVAAEIKKAFPGAASVEVRLLTGRHIVTIKGE